ncbi:MAG: acyltransferase [Phycisphaerae bacterium]|nr:acyltransferase [Phycisphaerae bacterium]
MMLKNDNKELMLIKSGNLTQDDSLRLKGIGIIMIVLHNFFHLLSTAPRENEFYFRRANSDAFVKILLNNPEEIIRCLFSFFGHFGVQIFIFVSAYGLTRKFIASKPAYWTFIKSRYIKIYPIFLMAIGLWLFKITFFSGLTKSLNSLFSTDLLYCVLTISNLVPGQHFKPVGPWWFMSFIFQFYFVFPVLFSYSEKLKDRGLILLGIVGILFMFFFNDMIAKNININLFFSFIGHLPEISLGMLLARREKTIRCSVFICFVALVTFALGILYKNGWYLNHISALICLLCLYRLIRPVCFKCSIFNKFLLFYGTISLPLFLTNGYLRQPLLKMAQKEPSWQTDVFYALVFLLIATVASTILHLCKRVLMQRCVPKIKSLILKNST